MPQEKRPSPARARAAKTGTPDENVRKKRHYLPAEERRRQILETTRPIFARAGLKGARTRELTQAAGINQATLFEHFRSKEELFTAAVVQPLVATIEGARERASAYASAASMDDQQALLHSNMEQELQRMIDIYPLLLQALASSEELGQHLYREQIVPLLEARADIMGAYVSDTLDPKLIQLASFGMFFALAMDHTLAGKRRDLADSARQLTELITNGCAPASRGASATPATSARAAKPASPARKALPTKKTPAAKKTPSAKTAPPAKKTSPAKKTAPVKNTKPATKAVTAKRSTPSAPQPASRTKRTATPKTAAGSRTRNK